MIIPNLTSVRATTTAYRRHFGTIQARKLDFKRKRSPLPQKLRSLRLSNDIMLSIVGISDAVYSEFASMQKGGHRAVTFKLDPSSKSKMEVDLDQTLPSDASHDQVLALLPNDDCRFMFFSVDYMEGQGHRTKTIFVLWVPSDAKVKNKMVYASAAVPLKTKLNTSCLSVQTGTLDAIDYEAMVEKCRQNFD